MGCVGQDEYADFIKEKAKESGMKTLFQVTDKAPTATCAVLLTDNNRSLVCHLGAANYFRSEFLDQDNNWSLIENMKIYYFTVSHEIRF
jgi:adenosine kinase